MPTAGPTNPRARGTDRLSERAVRAFIKKAEPGRKLSDGHGLYLTLTPAGSPAWRLKYRIGDTEKLFSIGVYPGVSLAQARAARYDAKELIKKGVDPVLARRLQRAQTIASDAVTFEVVAREWLERRAAKKGWSNVHRKKTVQAMERDILPELGAYPIARITPGMVIEAIDRVTQRGAVETASKELQNVVLIFGLAKSRRLIKTNPAADLAEDIIPAQPADQHHPALLTVDALRQVLEDFEHAPFSPQIRLLNRLLAFTAVRHANALHATWSQFDLDTVEPTWTIPRASMKLKIGDEDFRVPLSPTIAAELRAWRRGDAAGYLFPSPAATRNGGPLTLDALSKAYRSLGYAGKHTPHGWRSSFSTLGKESGLFDDTAIELALDHVIGSKVTRAYDRGLRWAERRRLMAWWDQQLNPLPADVLPLARRA